MRGGRRWAWVAAWWAAVAPAVGVAQPLPAPLLVVPEVFAPFADLVCDTGLEVGGACCGCLAWAARIVGDEPSGSPTVVDLDSAQGRVFMSAGVALVAVGSVLVTTAFDADTGDPLWQAIHDEGSAVAPTDLDVSPERGLVYVAGTVENDATGLDAFLAAYDAASGTEAWTVVVASPQPGPDVLRDAFAAVQPSPNGQVVYVAGSIGQGPVKNRGTDILVAAYHAADGQELWRTQFNAGGDQPDFGGAVDVSPDGSRVYVAGRTEDFVEGDDVRVLGLDALHGAILWTQLADVPGQELANDMAVAPDGERIYVAATRSAYALDVASGDVVWRFPFPEGSDADVDIHPYRVVLSPDGNSVLYAGTAFSEPATADWSVVALDTATGESRWATRLHGPHPGGEAILRAAGLGPDGSHLVAAGSLPAADDASDASLVVASFAVATGEAEETVRYDPVPGFYDGATDLVTNPTSGRVFVAGVSELGLVPTDPVLLAYDA